jgi:ligand-binding sensor domain-containing protein
VRARVPFCALLLALAAAFASADEWTPTRSFPTFSKTTHRGLPQSSVVALAQSSDGMLWIGTLDGVASFDGKSIEPMPDVKGARCAG